MRDKERKTMTKPPFVTGLALAVALIAAPASTTWAAGNTSRAGSMALVPRCQTSQLRGFIAGQNAGAGNIYTTLALRNGSGAACSIAGYPGVSLVDSAGRQIGRPARWDARTVHRLVLLPGGTASTTIRSLNPGVGTTDCLPPSAALRIFPPNQRVPLFVPARLSECLGTLSVLPFVAGTAGE